MKKFRVSLIFFVFFLIVLFEHQYLWLAHDDYGYASLTYGYFVENVNGTNFTLSQLIEFLIGHYNNWGGRILYFFIECSILSKGITLFRIVQSVVITGIFYYVYKIVGKYTESKDYIAALLSVSVYGFIELEVVKYGIFWISASVLYVFPLLPFLMFIYYYDSKNNRFLYNLFLGLLIFAASFSLEPISVAMLSYIIILTLYEFVSLKKINKNNMIMLIISFTGFFILVLCPGSGIRKLHPSSGDFYSLSLLGKILRNYPIILTGVFSKETKIFSSIFLTCSTYVSFKNYQRKKNLLNVLSVFSSLIILVFTLCSNDVYFSIILSFFANSYLKLCLLLVCTIQLGLIAYSLSIYFIEKKQFTILWIIYCAILSQSSMILAPVFPIRTTIMFIVLIGIVIVDIVCSVAVNENKMIIVPLVILSLFNVLSITKGYRQNNEVNCTNNQILKQASIDLKNGKSVDKIVLYKMVDPMYANIQPYEKGFEYILTWMYEYYDIPDSIEIVYE